MKRTLILRASAWAVLAAGSDTAPRRMQSAERKMSWGPFMREKFTRRPSRGPMLRKKCAGVASRLAGLQGEFRNRRKSRSRRGNEAEVFSRQNPPPDVGGYDS